MPLSNFSISARTSHLHPTASSSVAVSKKPPKVKSSLFRTRGRSLSLPQDDNDVLESRDVIAGHASDTKTSESKNLENQSVVSEIVHAPKPAPLFYGSTTDLAFVKPGRQKLPPIANALPNKSFLHSKGTRSLSKEFTSILSKTSESAEPFEFSPIMLTTSIVTVRHTRVIRSRLNNRADVTTSVFSNPGSPITSVLPQSSSPTNSTTTENAENGSESSLSIKENPIVGSHSENDLDINRTNLYMI